MTAVLYAQTANFYPEKVLKMNFDDMDCSTSKPVEAFNCSSNNRGQRDLTLGALVFYYIDKHRDRMKKYFRYYDQQTLNDAIRIAALSLRPDGKRHAPPKKKTPVCA